VDAGRCIPFLLLTYIVYFGLPALGIVLDKWSANAQGGVFGTP
jgi:hypothetical protein